MFCILGIIAASYTLFGPGGLTDTNGKRGVLSGALMVYQRGDFAKMLPESFVVGVWFCLYLGRRACCYIKVLCGFAFVSLA